MTVNDEFILGVRGISKRYGGVQALDDISMGIRRGESIALLGANGAGKSTLVKVLTGAVQPDSGEVVIDGHARRLATPRDARRFGIGFVPQELGVAEDLTVAENVLAGGWHSAGPFVAARRGLRAVAEVCERVGLDVDPSVVARKLSPAAKRLVMISRALVENPSILILDEPTAALAGPEAERLVGVVNDLRSKGLSVVYISHRMAEISRLCDSVIVLRNGRIVMTAPASEDAITEAVEVGIVTTSEAGTDDAVKASADDEVLSERAAAADTAISVRCSGLRSQVLQGVDLEVRTGEIVGLAGLLGSGRSEILRAIAGADKLSGGSIEISGTEVRSRSPRDAIRHGVALIPEDRRNQGGLITLSVSENLVLPRIPARRGWLHRKGERISAAAAVERFGIKCATPDVAMHTLSGGNQQKVILARWILMESQVLLLDEPTAGIDVVAKQELLGLVRNVVDSGRSALVVSSELEELCGYCDRIYIVQDGRIVGEVPGNIEASELARLCGSPVAVAA